MLEAVFSFEEVTPFLENTYFCGTDIQGFLGLGPMNSFDWISLQISQLSLHCIAFTTLDYSGDILGLFLSFWSFVSYSNIFKAVNSSVKVPGQTR